MVAEGAAADLHHGPRGRRRTRRLAQTQAQLRGLLRGGPDPDPAGELFTEVPVVYTCWLRDEATGEPPVKLFDAKCDHVGYVAANLAVRWHPQGDRILYVDEYVERTPRVCLPMT